MRVNVTIKNIGSRAGKEVAQLYVTAPKGNIDKPLKELKAFAKTRTLMPGESETLTMAVSKDDLASFVTDKNAWFTDSGTYTFMIGASSRDIMGEAKLNIGYGIRRVSATLANYSNHSITNLLSR